MSANQFDCELFVKGCEEIDRKRYVIKRVINSVIALLNKTDLAKKDSKLIKPTRVLTIPFGNLSFVLEVSLKKFIGILLKNNKVLSATGTFGGIEAVSATEVPIVCKNLAEVVKGLCNQYPSAGILEHFKFFSEQAAA